MAVVRANTEAVGAAARTCTNHPDRETLVSCGRCLRPFCTQCLIHTPAGQRCYECAGVRKDYARRASVGRFVQAFGVLFIGAAISTLLGFFSFFIAGMAGSYAGQTMSPAVTRHTRPWVYIPVVLVVFTGAWLGWSVATIARLLLFSAQRGIQLNVLSVPVAALFNPQLWVFLAIAAVVVFLRTR
jgi:hypothetical protein